MMIDPASHLIINKAITLILRQKRVLIFLSEVLQINNFIADLKLNAGLVLQIFVYSASHCLLIKSVRPAVLSDCV